MMIQNRDGSFAKGPRRCWRFTYKRLDYYAAVPAHLLDRENNVIDDLIRFAFDTLGAWRLDVRVYDEARTKALVEDERSC